MAMWFLWLILLIIFLIVEAVTVNTVTIWFAFGALFAMVADLFRLSTVGQIVLFVLVSAVCLLVFWLYFKPGMKDKTEKRERTNADRVIEQEGIVTETIDPMKDRGQILVLGQVWSAVSSDRETIIPKESKVRVLALSGVKAVVEAVSEGTTDHQS